MKTINKSAKRALSLVLSVAMLIGSLFVANVGININVDAATSTDNVVYYSGDSSDGSFITDGQHGSGTGTDPYIISTPEELRYVHQNMTDTSGKYFKIADGIDSFVLQSKAKIDANGGYDVLKNLTASEVNTWFSSGTNTNGDAWNNWHSSNNYFAGTLDFNGITVYGMYGSGSCVALISRIKGGTIKNVAVKSSYISTTNYGGFIAGLDNSWSTTTYDTIESCIVANCYMVCSKDTEVASDRYQAAGVIGGQLCGNTTVNNCMVYGNIAVHSDGAQLAFIGKTQNNATMIKNSIILDTFPYSAPSGNVAWGTCNYNFFSYVYTDAITTGVTWANYTSAYSYSATQIAQITHDDLKGSFVKQILSGLNWATDDTDGDWYAVAGEYPTPIKPDGWTDIASAEIWDGTTASGFESGSGTEADPFIIKTPAQLNKMVADGGKLSDGTTPAYYEVAEGVTEFYLNAATSRAAVESLVSGGTYNKWSFDATTFNGHFDGKGATIYGMVSNASNVGFVPTLGYNAVIENVIFEAAYVYGSRAAVIATVLTEYSENGSDVVEESTISAVAVRDSYIQSTGSSAAGATAAGFISSTNTPDMVYFKNCLFDGGSCTLIDAGTDATASPRAGMVSFPNWGNDYQMENCVSIDAYIIPMVTSVAQNTTSGTWYSRYTSANTGVVILTNCYSDVNPDFPDGVTISDVYYPYDRITDGVNEIVVTTAGVYDKAVMPTLDWVNSWSLTEVENDRVIPMPVIKAEQPEYSSYSEMLAKQQDGRGANAGRPYADGTNGLFHEFTGSGTEADPYIIYTALDLARAIGAGGVNLNDTLCFKLANDIDLSGMTWLNQVSIGSQYTYVPFKGTLDGDGHTIYGMSAGDRNGAGLIPVLDGGTVKNLHIRDSYAGAYDANSAGLIAGVCNEGSVITGCSVEDSQAVNSSSVLTGNSGVASVTYSYANVDGTSTYYDATANTPLTAADITADGETTWYVGGADNSTPKLLNRAKAAKIADVAGDDNCVEYDVDDLVALRQKLLKKQAFANIYGDVTRDGSVNVIDLAVLRRAIGDIYNETEDGFWTAVENGKMAIYYSENDTMDMARQLELYLEAATGVDIDKYATVVDTDVTDGISGVSDATAVQGTPDGIFDIVLVDSNDSANYANYSVAYDKENAVLTITGGSFTAVEQAVLAFAAGSDYETGSIYEGSGTIDTDTMGAKTVNGVTYYYAWGDEFDTGSTYSTDNWKIHPYKTEDHDSSGNEIQTGYYWNKENANAADLDSLYEITSDGKLRMWRGLASSTYNESTHSWGYKPVDLDPDGDGYNDFGKPIDANDIYVDAGELTTESSMLFKQGYIEMKASLPSDGHAFPAWWFLTSPSYKTNSYFDSTLYDKVYIENGNWSGANAMLANDLTTYKYQIPVAHLEYDIVEVMQAQIEKDYSWSSASSATFTGTLTGNYTYDTALTVHKIYDENVFTDASGNKTLYIPNWSTGTSTAVSSFTTTSSAGTFIHNYNHSNYDNTGNNSDKPGYYNFGSASDITGEHIFGFAWNVDESEGTYDITVYVDGTEVLKINQTTGHADNDDDPTYNNGDSDLWNQYAYMLLDNSYYTSNPYGSGTATGSWWSNPQITSALAGQFTDLLTQESGDKATFEVEYVRVYQQNNMRDIITPETEDFNTGNRFGYGK